MNIDDLEFRTGDWETLAPYAAPLRAAVFIEEQSVPEDLEWDGIDDECLHVVALTPDGTCVATARLTTDEHIGRMAVHPDWRGRGVGLAMLERLVGLARERDYTRLALAAQVQAQAFYAKLGFEAYGDVFDDAGIPHRMMARDL
ncbi:GNAT family N-acetyltransferase [Arhodomonas sp. AD133]|uniref:GNAT family N-acetyltransferase n=1 Tax=Arhodomonas sp. AD133 TaxID=3415009 RepID=UPI003EBCB1E0